MDERKWCIVYTSPSMSPKYVGAIESFSQGTRFLAHFTIFPSCAFALTREEAEKLLKFIKRDMPGSNSGFDFQKKVENDPTFRWELEKNGINPFETAKLQIIPVPWIKADGYPFEEVSEND